jgi:predicted metal-dependent hydrolase
LGHLNDGDLQRCLERGRALFNQGQFWEAHEAWEEAWVDHEDDAVRLLLQGLIQVAAGCHKGVVQQNARGAVRLLGSALEKLVPHQDGALGLRLDRFRQEVGQLRERARAWEAGGEPLTRASCPSLDRAAAPDRP